jgi:hypothetical protein
VKVSRTDKAPQEKVMLPGYNGSMRWTTSGVTSYPKAHWQ